MCVESTPPVVGTPLVCIRTHAWEWAASESMNGVGEGWICGFM